MTNSFLTSVCVDASALIKLAIVEDGSDQMEDLWSRWDEEGAEIVVPGLAMFEITSIIRKRHARGDINGAQAATALQNMLELELTTLSYVRIHEDALLLATELDEPVAYDAHYLALSRHLGCPFWTADKSLHRSALKAGIDAHLLGTA